MVRPEKMFVCCFFLNCEKVTILLSHHSIKSCPQSDHQIINQSNNQTIPPPSLSLFFTVSTCEVAQLPSPKVGPQAKHPSFAPDFLG